MEFLKRHYEKLILLFMLVAFIISMIHVLRIIQQTREVTEASLQIPTRKADYEPQNPEAAEFDVEGKFKSTSLKWEVSTAREKGNAEHFSDLVIPFAMARCPHCKKIIPRSYFQGGPEANKDLKEGAKPIPPGKCPLCDGELVMPPEKKGPIWKITAEDADGDGIDSNGNLYITGGEVYVSGPESNADGALDYDGESSITGGILIAAGASGMALNMGSDSTQGTILVSFTTQAAGTTISLSDESGNELIAWTSDKTYSSVVISTPDIAEGNTYTLRAGDYETTITMDSLVYGSGMGGFPGGGGGMGGNRPDGNGGMGGNRPDGNGGMGGQKPDRNNDSSGMTPPDMNSDNSGITPPDMNDNGDGV